MWQLVHEQPIVNSVTIDGNFMMDNLYETIQMSVGRADTPGLGSRLAALGVRYVIVGRSQPLPDMPEGLSELFRTNTGQVFEVNAEPAALVVLYTLRDGLWISEGVGGWEAETNDILIWNPLNGPVEARILLDTDALPGEARLAAVRVLTPHPEQIIFSGIRIDNPAIPPDYPPEPVMGRSTGDGIVFDALVFQPGETTLTLRWEGIPAAAPYPPVRAVHFDVPGLPGPWFVP